MPDEKEEVSNGSDIILCVAVCCLLLVLVAFVAYAEAAGMDKRCIRTIFCVLYTSFILLKQIIIYEKHKRATCVLNLRIEIIHGGQYRL